MSCIPSELEIAVKWFFNDTEVVNSPYYQLNPPVVNHYLTIPHLNTSNSGNYKCVVDIKDRVEETIALDVVPSKHMYI